jgi:hypothetical protein
MLPLNDLDEAQRHARRFYVCRKEAGRWVRCSEHADLEAALGKCLAELSIVAVFMASKSGGLLYWSSDKPDLFNSSILVEPVENAEKE